MQLSLGEKACTVKVKAGAVQEYRGNPGYLTAAVRAAAHYAKRNRVRMVVVSGNSYGCRVYHIARPSDDLRKFTVLKRKAKVVVVEPNGECFYAEAE